jgi:hypothetical protein
MPIMKIKKITANNKKKCFELETSKGNSYDFPYSRLRLKPSIHNGIHEVFVDKEVGSEGFTYFLESGAEDTVPLDAVLEYNQNQDYLREMLLYKLTLQAKDILKSKPVKKRELTRRLKTSPSHLYRLLDTANYNKTIDQMIKLLAALDCSVDIVFKKAA